MMMKDDNERLCAKHHAVRSKIPWSEVEGVGVEGGVGGGGY